MIGEYIGIPYDISNNKGLNCWGLVSKVYADLFSDTIKDFPSKTDNSQEIASVFAAAFATNDHGFKLTENPNNFDLIVFSRNSVYGKLYHCGIMYNGKVLHSSKAVGGVALQSIADAGRGFREFKFWQR